MQLFRNRDLVDTLEDLLDSERAAILNGRMDLLARMMTEKERLVKTPMSGQTVSRLTRLRRKADRNHAMLLASSQGVQAVAKRLRQAITCQKPLQTYDNSGHSGLKLPAPGKFERRA